MKKRQRSSRRANVKDTKRHDNHLFCRGVKEAYPVVLRDKIGNDLGRNGITTRYLLSRSPDPNIQLRGYPPWVQGFIWGENDVEYRKKKTTVNIRYNAAIDEAVTSFKKDLWEEHCPKNTYEELHCTRAVNDAGEVYRRLLEDRKTEEVAKRSKPVPGSETKQTNKTTKQSSVYSDKDLKEFVILSRAIQRAKHDMSLARTTSNYFNGNSSKKKHIRNL